MAEVLDLPSDALVTIPEDTAFSVFTSEGAKAIEPFLAQIRRRIDEFQPSLKTATSRKQIASMARKVSESKVYLEGIGKQLADEQKQIPKRIDATRAHIKTTLDKWRDEVRQPLTDWENAEERRLEYHKSMLAHIEACGNGFIDGKMYPYAILFRELEEKIVVDSSFEEFEPDGHRLKAAALEKLRTAFEAEKQRQSEREELEALRREKADRDAAEAERARKVAAEQAEKAKIEAAAKAEKDALEKAELEKTLTAEREKNAALAANLEAQRAAERKATEIAQRAAAEKAEAERKAQVEAAEQAKRDADKNHKRKVNVAAIAALVEGGVPEDMAKIVVTLIVKGAVPAIAIKY